MERKEGRFSCLNLFPPNTAVIELSYKGRENVGTKMFVPVQGKDSYLGLNCSGDLRIKSEECH